MIADFIRLWVARLKGDLHGSDRIVLASPFGHGADNATFNGIATANFRGLNHIDRGGHGNSR